MLAINQRVYAAGMDYSIGRVILKMILYLGIIILVLFMAMYGAKFVAKNSKRFVTSRYMKIVDVLNLGANFKIMMVEIDNLIYVIALAGNSIELIDKLPKDSIVQIDDFQEHLTKYTSHFKGKHMNSLYKNLDRILNRLDTINDKEEVDNEEDR